MSVRGIIPLYDCTDMACETRIYLADCSNHKKEREVIIRSSFSPNQRSSDMKILGTLLDPIIDFEMEKIK